MITYYDDRFGGVVGILAYYAKGRGFHSRTVQKFVCVCVSVCIGSGCFLYTYNMLRISNKYGSLTRNKFLMKSLTTSKLFDAYSKYASLLTFQIDVY
jgi:hypothetical protein